MGGVDKVGVEGLEFGVEVAGLLMTGVEVEEAEVMVGSSARGFDSTSFQQCY